MKAVDEKYYKKLKKPIIGYKTVTIKQFFDHLDTKWCRINTAVRKEMKDHYFRGWELDDEEAVDDFAKRLDEEQAILGEDGVEISDQDKLDHYLGVMGGSAYHDLDKWASRCPFVMRRPPFESS